MLAVAGILFVEAVGKGPWWSAPFRVCLDLHAPQQKAMPSCISQHVDSSTISLQDFTCPSSIRWSASLLYMPSRSTSSGHAGSMADHASPGKSRAD